jgi:8-amino-7-oxononanoate synthase
MSIARPLEARVRERLAEWRSAGLLRSPHPPSGIDFSSNDYLNLSTHPLVVDRLAEAARRDGVGSTGSRLLRGDREVFHALERRFAGFKKTEGSLYFSSGYLANLAVLTTLTERGDVVFSDELNHASLIDGVRLSAAHRVVFPHNDVDRLAQLLDKHARQAGRGHRFVVVESLFSMDGDIAPLEQYAALCRAAGASLIVDEAHAVGLYGERGSGVIEAAGVDSDVCVSINTAGKALGVSGAFVAGPQWVIDYLTQRARAFVFSTAAAPPLAAAIDASLDIVEREPDRRERVIERSTRLRRRLADEGVPAAPGESQIIPVVIGGNAEAVAIAAQLQAQGYDVRAIRPPSVPPGTARLRISVNAGLSETTIDQFAAALAAAMRGVGLCSAASS